MNTEKIYQVKHTENREEAVWLTDFTFPWLEQKAPETRFRAWHHDDLLCFEFQVEDADVVLDDSDGDDEKVLGSDRVELFFSPTPDLSAPYYGFEMDPRGLVYDYEGRYHRQFDPSWALKSLETAGTITSNGYHLEGSFPCEALRSLGCLRGSEMVTGVYRGEFSHLADGSVQQDWISWVDPGTETPDFHVAASFGMFVFGE